MKNIKIKENLFIDLPDHLDLTFQILSDYSEEEKVLCGWNGDDLQYALIVDDQPGGIDHDVYWNGLLEELYKDSDTGTVNTIASGDYKNSNAHRITYKALKTISDDEEVNHLFYLIVGETIAYWIITIFMSATDLFKVNGEVRALVENLRLEE